VRRAGVTPERALAALYAGAPAPSSSYSG